jgi:tripartite-type tricarboxylate transporter receptor subunit TctC
MATLGYQPVGKTPEECAKHIRTEATRWAKVIHDAGIKAR